MNKKYILGIDLGTTRAKVLIADRNAGQAGFVSEELKIINPKPGWEEQNPVAVWETLHFLIMKALKNSNIVPNQIAAIGMANQRESTVLWNKRTGKPYGNAVLWMDKRAENLCVSSEKELGCKAVERTGIYTIPNTAAMLLTWLLRNDPEIKQGVGNGEAVFGTMNSWLLWKLTGEKILCTDIANMSVTQLQNSRELDYDKEVLDILKIPANILPEIKGTGEIYGMTSEKLFTGVKIPVAGMLGDQMAAVLGQGCVRKGMVKSTYGTGCFTVMNTGAQYFAPAEGLYSPILWGDRKNPVFGLEGFYENYSVRREKAAIEEAAFKTAGIISKMEKITGENVSVLRIDGGMAGNDHLCQLQADISGKPVERPSVFEATALGAVYQAGITVGFWNSYEETSSLWKIGKRFEPGISDTERERLKSVHQEAVKSKKNKPGVADNV